jgi:hypothetical protein
MAGDIESALHSAASISDQKAKIDQYKLLLSSIICTNNVAHSKAFIDHSTFHSTCSNLASEFLFVSIFSNSSVPFGKFVLLSGLYIFLSASVIEALLDLDGMSAIEVVSPFCSGH